MKYEVKVTETIVKTYFVEADSIEEAEELAFDGREEDDFWCTEPTAETNLAQE